MDKNERLIKMFEYARQKGICRTKQEFSKHIGIANSNLSHAFNGDTRYLNDNLLKRVNESLENTFSLEWLIYGEGDMFANSAPQESSQDVPESVIEESIPNASERIKHLEDLVETLQAFNKVLRKDNERLEKENDALKNEKYYTTARTKNA